MHVNGSIPIHVARAYGVTPNRTAAPPTAARAPATVVAPVPSTGDRREPSDNIKDIVAARVDAPVEFSGAAVSHAHAYQLYTRAADRIEAAVGVQLGRSIDVKG